MSAACKDHPDAPHGFLRNESHSEGRYVCECEFWEPSMSDVMLFAILEMPSDMWGDDVLDVLQREGRYRQAALRIRDDADTIARLTAERDKLRTKCRTYRKVLRQLNAAHAVLWKVIALRNEQGYQDRTDLYERWKCLGAEEAARKVAP